MTDWTMLGNQWDMFPPPDITTTANTWTATQTFRADPAAIFTNRTDANSVQLAIFEGDRATMADNDEGYLSFRMSDAVGVQTEVVRFVWRIEDVTNATEDGYFRFQALEAGTLREILAAGYDDAGAGLYVINEDGRDVDTRIETSGNANMIVVDGGLNSLGFGRTAVGSAFQRMAPSAFTSDGSSTVADMLQASGTITGAAGDITRISGFLLGVDIITQTATENIADIAQLVLNTPVITDNLTGDITRASTILINGIPSEGGVGGASALANYGLMIDGGASDAVYIGLASSDIAHGLTGQVPTDVFFAMFKSDPTSGGTTIRSVAEDVAVTSVFQVNISGGTATTTKTTSGVGLFDFIAREHNGANADADITADGVVVSMRARVGGSFIALWLLDEDGDTYQNGDIWGMGAMTVGTVSGALGLAAASGSEVVVNDAQANVDFRVESDTNSNLIHADAGLSRIGFGTAARTDAQTAFAFPAETLSSGSAFYRHLLSWDGAATINTVTLSIFATVRIPEPGITIGTGGVTTSASLYIDSAATEATNNYALFVDQGDSRFDGTVRGADGTAGAPEFTFESDTDTGLYRAGANDLRFTTAGTQRLRISSARVEVGNGSGSADLAVLNGNGAIFGHNAFTDGASIAQEVQILGTSTADSSLLLGLFAANTTGPHLVFVKTRGAAIGDANIVGDNDQIGIIEAAAGDGVNRSTIVGRIRFMVDDASPVANSVGGDMGFWTSAGVSADDLTERMRIHASGHIGFAATQRLYLDGVDAAGDTYVYESAANNVQVVTGGAARLDIGTTVAVAGTATVNGTRVDMARKRKTADETITSDTTFNDDNTLTFAVGANEEWMFHMVVFIKSGAVPDFKTQITVPTSATGFYNAFRHEAGLGEESIFRKAYGVSAAWNTNNSDDAFIEFYGTVETAGTSGTVALQWAQNASDASNTSVREHSTLRAWRID